MASIHEARTGGDAHVWLVFGGSSIHHHESVHHRIEFRVRLTYLVAFLALVTHWLAFHSHHMYRSERFGGEQTVIGTLFYLGALWTVTIIFFDVDELLPKCLRPKPCDPVPEPETVPT